MLNAEIVEILEFVEWDTLSDPKRHPEMEKGEAASGMCLLKVTCISKCVFFMFSWGLEP